MGIFSRNNDKDDFFQIIDAGESTEKGNNYGGNNSSVSHALTPEEILSGNTQSLTSADGDSPLEALKKRMMNNSSANTDAEPTENENRSENVSSVPITDNKNSVPENSSLNDNGGEKGKTLLEKCMPYIVDDNGKKPDDEKPAYNLESVADILKSDSKKTIERLSRKYEITFDDLGRYGVNDNKKESPAQSIEDESKPESFSEELNFGESRGSLPDISDIDNAVLPKDEASAEKLPEETGTIRFTPVTDDDFNTSHISVSSQTRSIDLTGEFVTQNTDSGNNAEDLETELEASEFEEYVPKEEYSSPEDTKKFLRSLSLSKRNRFLKLTVSVVLALIIALFRLPLLSSFLVSNTRICMIICTCLLCGIIGANYDIFRAFSGIFTRRSSPDICACFAVIGVAAYTAFGFYINEITLDLMLLSAVILAVRSIGAFIKASYMLSNFKQICTSAPKRGIKLINDNAVTFAMAKDAVEGDVLIAAPQRTDFINDYMKYSTFGIFLSGRLPAVTAVSVLLAVICGIFSAAYYGGMIYGFYSAAVILCIAAVPTLFLIDVLPLYSASKRLNRCGAMIAGKAGAESLEMANAVVFSSEDLFPSGTVTLHNMKVLSENNIDETIIRAASLTEAVGSPLTNIFKKIAGNSNITALPDSDTVKYEDRMGVSGWVDNQLLFIGNRTLMEAHGISVPDVSLDKKILRKGYFPVYLASENKAVALIVVQYSVNPEIAHQMRRITALGITVLVNNTDPNLSEEMICDYLGLYEDSVKVISSAGRHMYKNATVKVKSASAPAAYKGNPLGLASLITSASKIKKSNLLLSVFYIIASVIGAAVFIYTSFAGSGSMLGSTAVMLYGIVCTAVSYILYLTERP